MYGKLYNLVNMHSDKKCIVQYALEIKKKKI